MKIKLFDLDRKELSEIDLNDDVFGLDVRPDIIKRVIDWQLAKRRSGNHHSKTISQVSGTTKKPHAQKGTGRARQGSLRQVHMRGGAVSHGPVVRSHEYHLPKKIRSLGLKHALSAKMEQNSLIILDSLSLEDPKTSLLKKKINQFGYKNYFLIDDKEVNKNFALASKSLHNVNVVPQIGANVYDIIKHECLLITQSALTTLVERLK